MGGPGSTNAGGLPGHAHFYELSEIVANSVRSAQMSRVKLPGVLLVAVFLCQVMGTE